jgi:tetratricopeptide (TPR) repeat protein
MLRPDLAKAIGVLKAVPLPNEEVLARMADYLGRARDPEGARPYLEALAVLRPSGESFFQLLTNYLQTRHPNWDVLLEKAEGPKPSGEKVSDADSATIRNLKNAFQKVPEHEGLRLAMLALEKGTEEAGARDSEKAALRKEALDLCTRALAAYEAKQLNAPLFVLNNLAWYLSLEEDAPARERAVELARRAVAMAPDAIQAPHVHDTHAWCVYRSGKLADAKRLFLELLQKVEGPSFRFHLATVHLELMEYDEALVEVRKALSSTQDFSEEGEARALEQRIKEARRRALGAQ